MTIHCINLHERSDKWQQAFSELSKLVGVPIRWPAQKISPGWEGCKKSHWALIRYLWQNHPDELWGVFEDDVKFCSLDVMEQIRNAIGELPNNWDMLYLGGTPNEPLERVTDSLFRAKKTWTTHAIIYNPNSDVVPFVLENMLEHERIDVFYANVVQEKFNCYMAYPMIATQRNGYSDIRQKVSRTGDYIKQHYDKFVR